MKKIRSKSVCGCIVDLHDKNTGDLYNCVKKSILIEAFENDFDGFEIKPTDAGYNIGIITLNASKISTFYVLARVTFCSQIIIENLPDQFMEDNLGIRWYSRLSLIAQKLANLLKYG